MADKSLAKSGHKNSFLMNLFRDRELVILCIPMIVFYLLFCYGPMYGAIIAFKDFKPLLGIWGSPWAGFKYFNQVITDPFFFRLVKNTFLIGLYSLLWGFPIPIIFALLINEVRHKAFKRVAQTLSYLPYFVSVVIVCGLMWNLLSPTYGVVNTVYTTLTGKNPIPFMTLSGWFRTLYVGSGIWQTFGWSSIIYIAAISGVNIELYDSAKVDGANRFQQIIHVTFPNILSTIFIMLILNIGNIMGVGFEKIILMYTPATYSVADVISTYTYRMGILNINYSFGAAFGLFNSVINLIFVWSANWLSRRYSDISLW